MKVSPTVRASLELLGVEAGVSAANLKKAYYKMALLYHPDRNVDSEPSSGARANGSQEPGKGAAISGAKLKSSEADFHRVTEAYQLLSDPLRVSELNRKYLRERLHRPVIEGLEITFGTFFGYRIFSLQDKRFTEPVALLPGFTSRQKSKGSHDSMTNPDAEAEPIGPLEENNSILDHAAYDAIEVAYAGRLSATDEEALKGQLGGVELARLPWAVLNNQGLLRFLDGDIRGAQKRYHELCERVPNNIIFTYRLGICLILDGFQKPRRTLLGVLKPDRIKIAKGLKLLEHCLHLGLKRSVGRQKCLVIRKTIADVLEKLGRKRAAQKQWQEIIELDPRCTEAVARIKGVEQAKVMIKNRRAQREMALGSDEALRKLSSGQLTKASTAKNK